MKLLFRKKLINRNGNINFNVINYKMSYEDLKKWIQNILEDKIPGYLDYRNELPFSYLNNVYHQLNTRPRKLFEDAIIASLIELKDLNNTWLSNAGDSLLLLTAEIFNEEHLKHKPITHLLGIAQNKGLENINGLNLRMRAYQTLISINYRAPESHWNNLFVSEGENYAPIVIGGLLNQSISATLDWIVMHINYEDVFEGFTDYLPWIIENYPEEKFKQKLLEIFQSIEINRQEILQVILNQYGINFSLDSIRLPEKIIKKKEAIAILEYMDTDFNQRMTKMEMVNIIYRNIIDFIPTVSEVDPTVPLETRVVIGIMNFIFHALNKGLEYLDTDIQEFILNVTERYGNHYSNDPIRLMAIDKARYLLVSPSTQPEEYFLRYNPNDIGKSH